MRTDEIAGAQSEIRVLRGRLIDNEEAIADAKHDLAKLAGIADPDQIVFTNTLVELDVDFGRMDIGYLKAMALLKRPDLEELRALLDIADSETAEEKAKRFPMINFFDFDYSQSFENGDRSSDEFGAQIGMSIPLMSLFKNKAHAASKREAMAYARQIQLKTATIGREVDLAVSLVRKKREILLKRREHAAGWEAQAKQTIASIGSSSEDADRLPEAKFESLEEAAKAKQDVVKALRDYNRAIRALESTIGADLDSAMGKEVSQP